MKESTTLLAVVVVATEFELVSMKLRDVVEATTWTTSPEMTFDVNTIAEVFGVV